MDILFHIGSSNIIVEVLLGVEGKRSRGEHKIGETNNILESGRRDRSMCIRFPCESVCFEMGPGCLFNLYVCEYIYIYICIDIHMYTCV